MATSAIVVAVQLPADDEAYAEELAQRIGVQLARDERPGEVSIELVAWTRQER
jgi:hypothetical protein